MALELKNYDPAVSAGANIGVSVDLTDITDASGNEVIEIDGVTSAVNYLRIANSATGTAITLTATGDDTNVDFLLTAKGTAVVLIGDQKTGTVTSGAVTLNSQRGVITTANIFNAQGTAYAFDLVNNKILTTSVVQVSVQSGTNTTGFPIAGEVVQAVNGSATIKILNGTATAMDGTVKVNFVVL